MYVVIITNRNKSLTPVPIHFVIECPTYDDIRNELFFSNPNIPPSDKFLTLSENKKLIVQFRTVHFARSPMQGRFIDTSDVIHIVGHTYWNYILYYITMFFVICLYNMFLVHVNVYRLFLNDILFYITMYLLYDYIIYFSTCKCT